MDLDTTRWSGDGAFTQTLIDSFQHLGQVACLRVEDVPSSQSGAEYNFISNELFVEFRTRNRAVRGTWLGLLPVTRSLTESVMTVTDLEHALSDLEDVGPPDYADDGMLQYLRTERIVPPYQTRGYKLVELVRIYETGATPRRTENDG